MCVWVAYFTNYNYYVFCCEQRLDCESKLNLDQAWKKEKFLFLHSTPFFSFPCIQHTHCFVVMQCPWQTCRAGTWCVTSLFLYMTSSVFSFSLYGGFFLCVTVQYLYHLVASAANCSQYKKMHWAIFSSLDTIETSQFRFFKKNSIMSSVWF